MIDKSVNIDNSPVQLFSGDCSMNSDILLDSLSIRCLSIKEKVKVAISSIHLTGKSTIVAVTQVAKETRTDLYVPTVPKQEGFDKMLQTTLSYQNLYDNKLRNMEERLELAMSRQVQSLTESINSHYKELQDRIEVVVMSCIHF